MIYLSPSEAAHRLGISLYQIKALTEAQEIPCYFNPVNHYRQYREKDVVKLLKRVQGSTTKKLLDGLLTATDCAQAVKLNSATFSRMVKLGQLPGPILKLASRCYWKESQLADLKKARPHSRRKPANIFPEGLYTRAGAAAILGVGEPTFHYWLNLNKSIEQPSRTHPDWPTYRFYNEADLEKIRKTKARYFARKEAK